jgi:cephalosporin-C deacetylase
MKKLLFGLAMLLLAACSSNVKPATGYSEPDLGWLFLEKGPYVLNTKVSAAPGEADFKLVRDISLMADEPDVVLETSCEVAQDSTISVDLGVLEPGFYEVRLRDSVRWNIGIRPDDVISAPDAPEDFDAFWESTLAQMDEIPLEPVFKEIPEYSNELRTCYEVSYESFGGATAGGIISIPVAPGKYPVLIQYMGYGAFPFYFDPSASPDRIDFLVSVRGQGIFRESEQRWIDRGLASKEDFYYRGAFADVKRAVDFVASLDKADVNHMVAMGESQGGAFTVVAAALDKRIVAASPAVPFLGDYPDYARIVWWPVHEVLEQADADGLPHEQIFEMLRYFDVKNFAPKVTCPVYMAFGLQDPTCPPHTNFAIYNNLGSKEKNYFCVPTCGHAMWLEQAWPPVRDAFFKQYLDI